MKIADVRTAKGVSLSRRELAGRECPSCTGSGLSLFYEVDSVPVHSCVLVNTKSEAIEFPRSGLGLGFCPKCGFITNARFDDSFNEYSSTYEETQGFSDCFNAFARQLAENLIDKYHIHGKTILEIGCGKGEFIELMCRLGDNTGIGIDPAYVPNRNPDTQGRVEFIQDLYSEKYTNLEPDVICCRHTLEHLGLVMEFMRTVGRTIGNRRDVLVIFEVPDILRVLKEGAFWDIYYEHCSYFSLGSVARLFRMCGFEIDDLYATYDDQYLVVTAYPSAKGVTASKMEIENDMAQLTAAVDDFEDVCSGTLSHWHSFLDTAHAGGQKTVLWGGGSKAVAFLATLKIFKQIEYAVDINPYKQGKFIPGTGQQVVSPEFLKTYLPDNIVVMNPVYQNEIRRELDSLGVTAEIFCV